MGGTPSVNLKNQNDIKLTYFSVQMSSSNEFRLILAPDDIINKTRDILNSFWSIKDVHNQQGFVQFKLNGTSWWKSKEEELDYKYFVCNLLKGYYELGWHLKASTNLEESKTESDTLFFQKSHIIDTDVICLSINSPDKIRVVSPQDVYPIIKESILNSWPRGLQREKPLGRTYEFKLEGYPWIHDSLNTPTLVLEIIENLFKNGWRFISAIDSGDRASSFNSLYFYYDGESDKILEDTRFFGMSLISSDRIRFHQADEEVKNLVLDPNYGIPRLWLEGIQKHKVIDNTLEVKLKGYPWESNGHEEVLSRRLLNGLFNLFARNGWNLYATCEINPETIKKSTFIFRSRPIFAKSNVNSCLSLNGSDKIRLIDFADKIILDVCNEIVRGWPKGIQKESDFYGSNQIKLNGYPFSTSGSERVYSCAMMTLILSLLEERGYRLLCNAAVSQNSVSGPDGTIIPFNLDSWFYEK